MAWNLSHGNFNLYFGRSHHPMRRRLWSGGYWFGIRAILRIGGLRRGREHGRFADFRRTICKFSGRHIGRVPFYQWRFRRFDPALLRVLRSRIARAASAQDIADSWWRAVISPSYARQSFTGLISLGD